MKSRIEKVRITLARVFIFFLILFTMVTGSAWQGDLTLASSLLFFLGIFFATAAAAGRLWASLYIAGRKTRMLVTIGPYSICRNPLYLFNLLGGVGVALTSRTLLIPATVLIGFSSYFPLLILREEKKLKERHGTSFEVYTSTIPRFWPDFKKLKEPEFYLVKPVIFRNHLFSAGGFLTFVGFIEIIRGLQSMSLLPILFRIY
jgi:protein-S-isoprenylcysteine O-methyltransferase Ste14